MFASTATFEHLPGPKELWTPMLPNAAAPSVVHTEEAFGTCEEANADALDRARHEIFALNGARPLGVRKSLGNVLCNVSHQESDESLAARFEVTFDGKRYAFRQYRYDRFHDALRYAMGEHVKDGFVSDDAFCPIWKAAYCPSGDEEAAMQSHRISYVEGHFVFGCYRYDRLDDAIAFAEIHPESAGCVR